MSTEATRATVPSTVKGMLLPCPRCETVDARIQLDLDDMNSLFCRECEEVFTVANMRFLHVRWACALEWIDRAPTNRESK